MSDVLMQLKLGVILEEDVDASYIKFGKWRLNILLVSIIEC